MICCLTLSRAANVFFPRKVYASLVVKGSEFTVVFLSGICRHFPTVYEALRLQVRSSFFFIESHLSFLAGSFDLGV